MVAAYDRKQNTTLSNILSSSPFSRCLSLRDLECQPKRSPHPSHILRFLRELPFGIMHFYNVKIRNDNSFRRSLMFPHILQVEFITPFNWRVGISSATCLGLKRRGKIRTQVSYFPSPRYILLYRGCLGWSRRWQLSNVQYWKLGWTGLGLHYAFCPLWKFLTRCRNSVFLVSVYIQVYQNWSHLLFPKCKLQTFLCPFLCHFRVWGGGGGKGLKKRQQEHFAWWGEECQLSL